VESQHSDVRISQYADIHYASKKMANGKWFWLDPLEGGRSGYLVCTPSSPIVWIDEQFKQSFRIAMRVNSPIYEKTTILIASLNKTEGILRLEDAWMVAGKSFFDATFTKRWEELLRFYSTSYKVDAYLQQGLRIEPAVYKPLADAVTWSENPECMFAQGDTFPRRLRVQITPREDKSSLHTKELAKQMMKKKDMLEGEAKPKAGVVPGSSSSSGRGGQGQGQQGTFAIPHDEYPDTYTIRIDGVNKGYAAVQDIALSRQLRTAASSASAALPVKVEWNSEFSMYEIISVL
jgi:hypothetical protein